MLQEAPTIEDNQVTIGSAEVELHELNGEENGRHNFW